MPEQKYRCCQVLLQGLVLLTVWLLLLLLLLQLRTLCQSNDQGKALTDILGTDWLTSLTSQQVCVCVHCTGRTCSQKAT
jgi:hypothetical protein